MRTGFIASLAVAATLAVAGMTSASALPVQPSAIAKGNVPTTDVLNVQWRRNWRGGRHWGPRFYGNRAWGPRFYGSRSWAPRYYGNRYWGPRYYGGYSPYSSYGYYRPFPAPFLSIGPGGFRFGIW